MWKLHFNFIFIFFIWFALFFLHSVAYVSVSFFSLAISLGIYQDLFVIHEMSRCVVRQKFFCWDALAGNQFLIGLLVHLLTPVHLSVWQISFILSEIQISMLGS